MKTDFEKGIVYGKNAVFTAIFNQSEKRFFLGQLFVRVNRKITSLEKNDPMRQRYNDYREGIRHCLNVLDNYGDSEEAYENIINPSIKA